MTKDLLKEIATHETAGAGLGFDFAALPDPDPVLLKSGKTAEVLKELLADGTVWASIRKIRDKVKSKKRFKVEPGHLRGNEATDASVNLAEAFETDLEKVDIDCIISGILEAPFFGFTPIELIWKTNQNGGYVLENAIPKPRDWFSINAKGAVLFEGGQGQPEPVPEHKIVLARNDQTYENPYGVRLLSRCFWPVVFKRSGLQYWMRYLDKYGVPWLIFEAPQGATKEEKVEQAEDIKRIIREGIAVVTKGSALNALEPKVGSVKMHKELIDYCDEEIRIVLEGQTLTSSIGDTGSRAASETHYSVLDYLCASVQSLIEKTMTSIAWHYGQVNAPGVPAPVWAFDEPEDLYKVASLDKMLFEVGAVYTNTRFTEVYGIPKEHLKEQAQSLHFSESPGPETAALKAQEGLDRTISTYTEKGAEAVGKSLESVLKEIEKTGSYAEMQTILAAHLGRDLTEDELAVLMTDLLQIADLQGQASGEVENA